MNVPVAASERNSERLFGNNDFAQIVAEHRQLDLNQDQHPEIIDLQIMEQISPGLDQGPGLLVLVEQRLLDNDQTLQPNGQLSDQLALYSQALSEDGLAPIFLAVDLERSERHQDGQTLLALRRLLQATKKHYPDFQGTVLLGAFPEAMLVRRWAWLHGNRAVTFGDTTYNKGKGPRATYLAFDPELVSHRTDCVLMDLDGPWESLYVQPATPIDCIKLIADDAAVYQQFKNETVTFSAQRFSIEPKTYQDFFFIDDAQLKIVDRQPDSLTLETTYQLGLPEVPVDQRSVPNPLAAPDILVSRINALHVAANPPRAALSETGRPQAVPADQPSPNQFQRSPELERGLLVDYLQRNLQHRRGETTENQNRAALLTTDLRTFDHRYLENLSDQFADTAQFHRATAVGFAQFMKTPALVKGISAHSAPDRSILMSGYDPTELADETGGDYWQWQKVGDVYQPSYQDRHVCNTIRTSLLRTMWENGKLKDTGSCFYIHAGCEATSPLHASDAAYHDPRYGGSTQIAESLMFFGQGLALIGRAKVFYDRPSHPERYFDRTHGRFGNILSGYYQEELASQKMGQDVAGRNRVYFWSILGDWTLRLSYPSHQISTVPENNTPTTASAASQDRP